MELFYVLASLGVAFVSYTAVSLRERSFINVLTPLYAVFIPGNYLSDLYALWKIGPSASANAYFLNYLAYAAFLGMTTAGYLLAVPAFRLRLASNSLAPSSRVTSYIFLALAVALYAPVLIRFKGDIFNPRAIYEQTRVGFGVNFFLSATLCYVGLVLFLFQKSSRLEAICFSLACLLFTWLHGSKGHMLGVIMILTMYLVYVAKRRVSIVGLAVVGTGLLLSVTVMFLVTNPGILLNSGTAMNLVGYSSYTANSMMLIDSNVGPLDGQVTLEQQLYSRIPRVLDPHKPHDFGDFYLAKRFFPAEFEGEQGAPSFGFGQLFADYGVLAPLILAFAGLINGITMKSFVNSLKRFHGPGEFILLLFAAGIPLIPMSNAFLILETIGIALVANLLQRFRLLGPRRKCAEVSAAG